MKQVHWTTSFWCFFFLIWAHNHSCNAGHTFIKLCKQLSNRNTCTRRTSTRHCCVKNIHRNVLWGAQDSTHACLHRTPLLQEHRAGLATRALTCLLRLQKMCREPDSSKRLLRNLFNSGYLSIRKTDTCSCKITRKDSELSYKDIHKGLTT